MSESTSFISSTIKAFKEGREEARRERKARELDYQTRLVEKFNYSPREFYLLLAKALEERHVPGLEAGLVKMYESVVGSPKRLYMSIARERFVYFVCAAPYGSGFFFSWRLIDERRPAKWFDFLATLLLICALSGIFSVIFIGPLVQLLQTFNFDGLSIAQFSLLLPLIFFLFVFAAVWSFMRCAALPGYERLAIQIEKTPFIGRVFERLFRPDTYYRQDSQKMYQKAFDYAINETITSVTTPQGLRNTQSDDNPAVVNLHRK